MKTFSIGLLAGVMVGAGVILAVHPMSKRDLKKACRRAGRFIDKMNNPMHMINY